MMDWLFTAGLLAGSFVLAVGATFISWKIGWRIGKREGHRDGWNTGYQSGYAKYAEEDRLRRERELINAGRYHEPRPDAAGTARVSKVRFTQRNG